jgi:hypothetical protein
VGGAAGIALRSAVNTVFFNVETALLSVNTARPWIGSAGAIAAEWVRKQDVSRVLFPWWPAPECWTPQG